MTPLQVIFLVVAATVISSAVMVVTAPKLVHAALWLVVTLFGVAITFVLLNASFLAVAQVVVYIGAIAILFIFAVMLTRRVMQDTGPQTNQNWWVAALIAGALFVGLIWMLNGWRGFGLAAPPISPEADFVSQLGTALVSPDAFVLPFELASVLLLAALIGAIMVATERN